MTDIDENVDEDEGSNSLGAFIRAQREMANLSLRQLSNLTKISNAYLSQIERNLHEPSIRVLRNVGDALGIQPERLMTMAGLVPAEGDEETRAEAVVVSVEEAILADPHITAEEKNALLSVYRSYRAAKP